MRTHVMAVASALALLAAPMALAQQSPRPATAPPGGSPGAPVTGSPAATPAPAPVPKPPAVNPLTQEDVSKLKGTDVYGSDGKKLGDVETALMKPDSKTIDRLVVKHGGVLGVGGHAVALPVEEFTWDADKGVFRVSKTEDELKSMAEWKAPPSAAGSTGSSSGR